MHTFVPENLYNYGTFRTKALVQGDFDAAAEFELVNLDENNVEVNATFAEEVVTVAYNWSETSFLDPEDGAAFILGDLYYTEYVTFNEYITSLTASNYKYYGIPESYYLCVLAINAAGEYAYIEYNVRSEQGGDEPVEPEDLIYTTGKVTNSYWSDVYVQLYGNDNTTIQLNGMNTCNNSQHYFTPGTYQVGTLNGHFYEGETCLIDNATGAQRGFYGGSIVISVVDEMYRIELDVTDAYGESFVAVFQGVIAGMDLPGEQGGDEPVQPEEVDPSDLVYNYAYTYGDWDDCTIYVISEDESYAIVMNFYGIIPYDKGYIPEGTYDFGSFYGAVYTGGYSYLYDFATQSASWIYAGTVAVSEVDGKYRLVINAQYGDTMKELSATFEGTIDGLLLPSQYVEPEPEPEPEVTSFPAVRAEYDNKFDLYEYNGGDAEYAFWLYDANNNYIEVIHRFGSHTGWNDVYEAKFVNNGVEYAATSVQTQAPNTWNCGAGELYFKVIATFADGTSVDIAAQLPAVEVNYLGEGSTYAPGSENQGGNEGGEEPEPEQPAGAVELTPYEWAKTFGTWGASNEFEIVWFDQDGHSINIDFLVNPIVEGTYTLSSGLSGMYTKYRGIGMTSCTVVVTDAGDGQLAFDVNFKAQIEGVFTDYHFSWVGDPSTL